MREFANFVIGGFLSCISWLFGGLDYSILILCIIMVIDYITGLLKAGYQHKINSKIGIKGIFKKIAYLLVVVMAVLLDYLTGQKQVIKTLVIYFFVANECISILENVGSLNIKLPSKLYDIIEQLKKEK